MPSETMLLTRNRLLRALPRPSLDAILPSLEPSSLRLREVLVEPGVSTSFAHFIDVGIASVVATAPIDGEETEVGHIGREGSTGLHVMHGVMTTTNRTFVQVAGTSHRIEVPKLLDLCEGDAVLRGLLLRYTHTCGTQLAQTALANARYSVHERVARWLLMSHDRVDGDDLPITHEFLSLMLGVRRSGVTNEIHILEGLHLIKASRGRVVVQDREGLERIAGGCYGLPEAEYAQLIDGRWLRAWDT